MNHLYCIRCTLSFGQDKAKTELGKRNTKLEKKKNVNKKRKKVSKSFRREKSRKQ